jgi:surface polysaccharide O-acyltransferase-like enzyme
MLLFHRKMWLLYLVATILLFSPFLNAVNEEEDEKDIIYTDVGAGSETGENSPAITSQIVSPRAVAVDL